MFEEEALSENVNAFSRPIENFHQCNTFFQIHYSATKDIVPLVTYNIHIMGRLSGTLSRAARQLLSKSEPPFAGLPTPPPTTTSASPGASSSATSQISFSMEPNNESTMPLGSASDITHQRPPQRPSQSLDKSSSSSSDENVGSEDMITSVGNEKGNVADQGRTIEKTQAESLRSSSTNAPSSITERELMRTIADALLDRFFNDARAEARWVRRDRKARKAAVRRARSIFSAPPSPSSSANLPAGPRKVDFAHPSSSLHDIRHYNNGSPPLHFTNTPGNDGSTTSNSNLDDANEAKIVQKHALAIPDKTVSPASLAFPAHMRGLADADAPEVYIVIKSRAILKASGVFDHVLHTIEGVYGGKTDANNKVYDMYQEEMAKGDLTHFIRFHQKGQGNPYYCWETATRTTDGDHVRVGIETYHVKAQSNEPDRAA